MNQIDTETGEILSQDLSAQASLFAKLARAMGALERVPKRGHNQHFNYAFVTDADVADSIRAALATQGVAFFATMRGVQSDGKKTIVQFCYTFADGETGATWSCDWQGEAIDSQDKGTAKAATSALKYFLLKNFILSTGDMADDTDADGATEKQSKSRPQKPAPMAGPAKPKAGSNETNGNKASVGTSQWAKAAKELAEKVPYYMDTNGPNYHHMLGAALKLGFKGITDANLADVIAGLEEYANAQANQAAAE